MGLCVCVYVYDRVGVGGCLCEGMGWDGMRKRMDKIIQLDGDDAVMMMYCIVRATLCV